jgi:two-component system LytT family response regulator
MKILIVDDSRLARKELNELVAELATAQPALEVIAEASDMASAVTAINTHKPDLVLLDIHLPDGDGFEVLEQSDFTPHVIFTTAYEQHALRAFEFNALDYLLKPVTAERLHQALQRAQKLRATTTASTPEKIKTRDDQIFIRDGEHCHFVRLHELRLLSVEGNYLRLFFRDTKALLNRSLNYIEERFDPELFFRANRQQMVNMDYVARVEPWLNDGLLLVLKDGTEVEVSRRQARELKQRMEL